MNVFHQEVEEAKYDQKLSHLDNDVIAEKQKISGHACEDEGRQSTENSEHCFKLSEKRAVHRKNGFTKEPRLSFSENI